MNVLKRAVNVLRGKTPEGFEKDFAAEFTAFVERHKERVAQWKEMHPDKELPIQINPKTKELVWANRKQRRK